MIAHRKSKNAPHTRTSQVSTKWVRTRTSQLATAHRNSQLAIAHRKSCLATLLCFLGDEDDADTGDDSILDVNNDQMFDDTIFTEYNDQNLSVMSNKMTKKWRKKWEKEDLRKRTFGAETIDRLVAKQESLLKIEELEKSSTTENEIHPEIVVSILESNILHKVSLFMV